MRDYLFITFVPDEFAYRNWHPLAWSYDDGWVDVDNRRVMVFSKEEIILGMLTGYMPVNPPFPVVAIHYKDVGKLFFEAKAYLN